MQSSQMVNPECEILGNIIRYGAGELGITLPHGALTAFYTYFSFLEER